MKFASPISLFAFVAMISSSAGNGLTEEEMPSAMLVAFHSKDNEETAAVYVRSDVTDASNVSKGGSNLLRGAQQYDQGRISSELVEEGEGAACKSNGSLCFGASTCCSGNCIVFVCK